MDFSAALNREENCMFYLSSWCFMTCKTSTEYLQSALPITFLFFSTALCHVILDLPIVFPLEAQVSAMLQLLFGSYLKVWLMNLHFLCCTSTLRHSMEACWSNSDIFTGSCHLILMIFLKLIHFPGLTTI